MPNGQFNPLTTLATSARQLNEQANQVVKSLGDSFTQTTNQFLASAAQGLPALPPLPGAQASNPGNGRGNSNGSPNGGPFPGLQQLVPTQALQAVSQVEDVLLPPGVPRPSQVFLGAAKPKRQPMEQPPATQPAQPPATVGRQPGLGVGGLNSQAEARRPGKALGVQAT